MISDILGAMIPGREYTSDDIAKRAKMPLSLAQDKLDDMVSANIVKTFAIHAGGNSMVRAYTLATLSDLSDRLLHVIGDGREYTLNDIQHRMEAAKFRFVESEVRVALKSMAQRKIIKSTDIDGVVIYRAKAQ